MKRRTFLGITIAASLLSTKTATATGTVVEVYKDPTCGCCGKWAEHLRNNGFDVHIQEVPSTADYRRKFGVPDALASCHTAIVDGYAIEGHVPAADIQRLLKEHPKARGLAVPGMPIGSPGMEGARTEAYSVMIFAADGGSSLYQSYPRR